MGVGSRIFLLLCFVIKLSIYSSVFPPKHDPRCAREEFQHWHAIFPESAAHSCLPLQPPMVDSSCIRGFVTNGSVPRAECCLMKTATENASRWVNFHGNPCVKSQTEGQQSCTVRPSVRLSVCLSICLFVCWCV